MTSSKKTVAKPPPKPANGTKASISALARASGKHRQTVVTMLDRAGVKPVSQSATEKLYDFGQASTVLRAPSGRHGLTEARRKKTMAELERIVLT